MTAHGAKQTARQTACNYVDVSSPQTAEPVPRQEPESVDLPPKTLRAAQLLTGAVHDEGPAEVAAILRPLAPQQLRALAVTLAAMVPVDYSPAELLAWNDSRHRKRT